MWVLVTFTKGAALLFEFKAPLLKDFPLTETFKLACEQFRRQYPDISLFDVDINVRSFSDADRT